MSAPQLNRVDKLELDIDTRLVDLWAEASLLNDNGGTWTLDLVAAFMRSAYARGYGDALIEPNRGQLYRDHGYLVPEKDAA